MAENFQTFHLFGKLPLELQFKIWKEGIKQTPPRVYELHDHEPSPEYWSNRRDHPDRPAITIAELTLYERSVLFDRPLLAIDRATRRENLRSYSRVKFLNAHVYINLEVDILYLGYFRSEALLDYFSPENRAPLWDRIQHLALGMVDVEEILECEDQDKPTWCVENLQQFSNLKTFTIVLDAIKSQPSLRWPPRLNGAVTFGSASLICVGRHWTLHNKWISYFKEQFQGVAKWQPEWNVPELQIKSIFRGGKLQQVDWTSFAAQELPAWTLLIKKLRERKEVEGSDLDSEADEEDSSSESAEDEDGDLDEESTDEAGVVGDPGVDEDSLDEYREEDMQFAQFLATRAPETQELQHMMFREIREARARRNAGLPLWE